MSNSDYLILNGDICDDLNESINYLNDVSKYYKKILYIDGNHEHVYNYPELYDTKYINNQINKINNNKIIYLPNNYYKINNTLFIGCCGWWDYNNEDKDSINKCSKYFENWIDNFKEQENLKFIHNVINKSKEEYSNLICLLEKYKDDNEIKDIIIVTHTVPHIRHCDNHSITDNNSTQNNTKLYNITKYKKIKKWIFGHTHRCWEEKIDGIEFICNPRGRPEDFNREIYNTKQIVI